MTSVESFARYGRRSAAGLSAAASWMPPDRRGRSRQAWVTPAKMPAFRHPEAESGLLLVRAPELCPKPPPCPEVGHGTVPGLFPIRGHSPACRAPRASQPAQQKAQGWRGARQGAPKRAPQLNTSSSASASVASFASILSHASDAGCSSQSSCWTRSPCGAGSSRRSSVSAASRVASSAIR
jgi:hypothetical protein